MCTTQRDLGENEGKGSRVAVRATCALEQRAGTTKNNDWNVESSWRQIDVAFTENSSLIQSTEAKKQ